MEVVEDFMEVVKTSMEEMGAFTEVVKAPVSSMEASTASAETETSTSMETGGFRRSHELKLPRTFPVEAPMEASEEQDLHPLASANFYRS